MTALLYFKYPPSFIYFSTPDTPCAGTGRRLPRYDTSIISLISRFTVHISSQYPILPITRRLTYRLPPHFRPFRGAPHSTFPPLPHLVHQFAYISLYVPPPQHTSTNKNPLVSDQSTPITCMQGPVALFPTPATLCARFITFHGEYSYNSATDPAILVPKLLLFTHS